MTKDEKIKEYLEILQKPVSDLTDDEADKGYKLAKDKDIQNVLEKARVEDFAKAASLPATMGAGAIRTVAGSMPAAAIDEEQAVAEFLNEISTNVGIPGDLKWINYVEQAFRKAIRKASGK